jgi:hypothetical protein
MMSWDALKRLDGEVVAKPQYSKVHQSRPALEGPSPNWVRQPIALRLTGRPMRKAAIAVAVAAVLWTPEASGQTILQKNDWRARPLETTSAPDICAGARPGHPHQPPKLDAPFGWQANALPPFPLHRSSSNAWVSSTACAGFSGGLSHA